MLYTLVRQVEFKKRKKNLNEKFGLYFCVSFGFLLTNDKAQAWNIV